MKGLIKLNHHAGVVLPYHLDAEGTLHFILEQKDPGYKAPFFDNALNFLGGNWQKGVHDDKTPDEVAIREVEEEFWVRHEPAESLNELLGQDFLQHEPEVLGRYNLQTAQRIQQAGRMLTEDIQYADSYLVDISPPICDPKLSYGLSVFTCPLSEEEFGTIEDLLTHFDGKLTTDNLRWGSRIVSISLPEINQDNRKFSWAYDKVMNSMFENGLLPAQPVGVLRELSLVDVKPVFYFEPMEKSELGCPTFQALEGIYEYKK